MPPEVMSQARRERLAALSVSASAATASSFAVCDVTRTQRSAEAPAPRALRAPDRGGQRLAAGHNSGLLQRTSYFVLRGSRRGRLPRNLIFEATFLSGVR